MKQILFVLVFSISLIANANIYYVATSGNNANDGLSTGKAWRTVTYAASMVKAGDIVYIKAGLYKGEIVVISKSGNDTAPIIFQGYKDTPGDTPDPQYNPGDTLNSTIMPVITGVYGKETGIYLIWDVHYVTIRNLAVTSFDYGIFAQMSDHIIVENVYVSKHGAHGIFFRDCSSITLSNSVSVDASMCNIILERTHDGLVENCKSYAVGYDSNVTDYHIVLMDAQDILMKDCNAYNMHWQQVEVHTGHGIGIKDAAGQYNYPNAHSSNNKIINCNAYNVGEYFFVAHEAHDNTFENCTAIGQFHKQNFWSEGINIRDGAHDNTFRNCQIKGIRTSIAFQDTQEGPVNTDESYKAQICQKNTLANCIFANSDIGIQLWNADSNLIKNCIFDSVETLLVDFRTLYINRKNPGNTCRNTVVTNIIGGYQGDWGSGDRISFTYSDYWNNSFDMPEGEGNLSKDPLFVDETQDEYHLKSLYGRWDESLSAWINDEETSPCIDAGDPTDDFTAEPCSNGNRINIGAYGGTIEASKSLISCLVSNETPETNPLGVIIYPNPFNLSTTINYQLPVDGTVNLSVYDMSGNEIVTLINGEKSAGNFSETLDGSLLSDGAYFIRLTVNQINGKQLVNENKIVYIK